MEPKKKIDIFSFFYIKNKTNLNKCGRIATFLGEIMSTEEKFKQLQDQAKKAHEAAIQVNAKIESAEESLERFLPILKEKYGTSNLVELEKMLEDNEKENQRVFEEGSKAVEEINIKVNEKNAAIRDIQNSMNS